MRRIFKNLSSRVLIPLTKWYLKKERRYCKDGINVKIYPGVFHPGLFFSTGFLYEYLQQQELTNKTFVEVGSGSGFLSVAAARLGARVTALDLNRKAVENTCANAEANHVAINTIESDLFDTITPQHFDWIVINPPYYAQTPKDDAALAWYCGANFEYFTKLFKQLIDFQTDSSVTIMVLTKGCDIDVINAIALSNQFEMILIRRKKVFFDGEDFLYQLKKISSTS